MKPNVHHKQTQKVQMLAVFLVIFFREGKKKTQKKAYLCRVCANGAACKYAKCFQAAAGWREAKLGVKVYFDVCAWRGNLHGHKAEVFHGEYREVV